MQARDSDFSEEDCRPDQMLVNGESTDARRIRGEYSVFFAPRIPSQDWEFLKSIKIVMGNRRGLEEK